MNNQVNTEDVIANAIQWTAAICIGDVIANAAQRNAAICQGLSKSCQEIASFLGEPRILQ